MKIGSSAINAKAGHMKTVLIWIMHYFISVMFAMSARTEAVFINCLYLCLLLCFVLIFHKRTVVPIRTRGGPN